MRAIYDFCGGRKMFLCYLGLSLLTWLGIEKIIPGDLLVTGIVAICTGGAVSIAAEDGLRGRHPPQGS